MREDREIYPLSVSADRRVNWHSPFKRASWQYLSELKYIFSLTCNSSSRNLQLHIPTDPQGCLFKDVRCIVVCSGKKKKKKKKKPTQMSIDRGLDR